MRLFGLIGWPLGHSFSKKYFTEKFERERILDARYELFSLETIAGLPALLKREPALCGLNVTIPHKENVVPFLDDLDDTARAVGAVNCINFTNGKRVGYNTDVVGFENSLADFWERPIPAHLEPEALILGTGGASKAVAHVLHKRGIPFYFVSRNPTHPNTLSYASLSGRKPWLIVNTTPLGTFPNVDVMPPLPKSIFHDKQMIYDLVYNPAETLLLREAKLHGAQIRNGLEMLQLQAEAAWEIWTGLNNQ